MKNVKEVMIAQKEGSDPMVARAKISAIPRSFENANKAHRDPMRINPPNASGK